MQLERKFLRGTTMHFAGDPRQSPPLREDEPGLDFEGEEGGGATDQTGKHGDEDTEHNIA